MKYFTPKSLLQLQDRSDGQQFLSALDEWEIACERYAAHLATLRAEFPPGLRHLEANYRLHDGVVRGMGQKDHSFLVMLQLDTPPHSLLTITFEGVQGAVIEPSALPPEYRSPNTAVQWLYDEWERVPGEPATWTMSALLSNGWEVRFQFRDVQVQEIPAILPVPPGSPGHEPSWMIPQATS